MVFCFLSWPDWVDNKENILYCLRFGESFSFFCICDHQHSLTLSSLSSNSSTESLMEDRSHNPWRQIWNGPNHSVFLQTLRLLLCLVLPLNLQALQYKNSGGCLVDWPLGMGSWVNEKQVWGCGTVGDRESRFLSVGQILQGVAISTVESSVSSSIPSSSHCTGTSSQTEEGDLLPSHSAFRWCKQK